MSQPDQLKYPVLCLSQDNSIVVADTPVELRQCNAAGWFTNHYFDNLLVIDATATAYRVVSAELEKPLASLGRLSARIRNARLGVVLELAVEGTASLANAKAAVVEWIHRDPAFWEASYDISEWEGFVSEVTDMRTLCAVFH